VVAEFNTKAETSDQVNHKYCIHFNGVGAKNFIEHPHNTQKLEEHHKYTDTNNDSDAQAAKNLEGKYNCCNS
jgi:hypothetical protein